MSDRSLPQDILVIDPDMRRACQLVASLTITGYTTCHALDAASVLGRIVVRPPDLVLLVPAQGDCDEATTCMAIRALSDVPIVVLASLATDDRVRVLEAGADAVLSPEMHPSELLVRLGAVLRRCGQPVPRCVPVGALLPDTAASCVRQHAGWSASAQWGVEHTVQLMTSSATLRELLVRCLHALGLAVTGIAEQPDLLLLDLAAPNAIAHCQALRERDPDLPIVALTALAADRQLAWESGATAILPIPFDVLDLQRRIQVLLGGGDA